MKRRVYRAASLLQVAHARNILLSAGIRCELRNQYLAGALGELPLLETWPELLVEEGDEQYALSMLRVLHRGSAAPTGAAWTCGHCQEPLEPQFTACWRCGAERGTAGLPPA
jgi:hypothetical protein